MWQTSFRLHLRVLGVLDATVATPASAAITRAPRDVVSTAVLSTETACLLGVTGLFLLLPLIYANLGGLKVGVPALLGNPPFPELPGWLGRAKRAHLNLIESLLPFAIVVLLLDLLGTSSPLSRSGAILFLVARAAHALLYTLGVPYLRSVAFLAGSWGCC